VEELGTICQIAGTGKWTGKHKYREEENHSKEE